MAKESLWRARSYYFVDRNPEIDRFQTLFAKEKKLKQADLAVLAGLSDATVKNMFGGQTRDPRHSTFAKMAGAMGFSYDLQRASTPDYEAEIPKAKEERKEYRIYLRRKREKKERASVRRPRRLRLVTAAVKSAKVKS